MNGYLDQPERKWLHEVKKAACPERAKRAEGLSLLNAFRTIDWREIRERLVGLEPILAGV